MTSAHWYLVLGSRRFALVLAKGLLARVLLSSATIYLSVRIIVRLVPRCNSLNPVHHAELLGRTAGARAVGFAIHCRAAHRRTDFRSAMVCPPTP
jgi:hypothetical protein